MKYDRINTIRINKKPQESTISEFQTKNK